ncbi:MAG: hypothetical protein K2L38_02860 [Dysosmobacter sp.]|nr:hypothetical protein [Dysosmobacter sp.]
MNDLQIFSYGNDEIRTVMIDGEPWFVLSDVCRVLGLSTPAKVAERLDEDEKGVSLIHTPGGPQEMTIISESGLYAVILRSDKPEAKTFRKWVTAEVLPTIRKKGGYIARVTSEELLAKALLAAQRALEGQTTRIAELEAENLGLLSKVTPEVDTWSEEEFEWMLTYALTAGREDYITILYLVRYAGLNLDECFSIDMETAAKAVQEKVLTVRNGTAQERKVALNPVLLQRIRWRLCQTQDSLFVLRSQTLKEARNSFQSFFEYYSKLARRVTSPHSLTFDGLRHTYATEKYQGLITAGKTPYEARKAVSRLLGHGRDDVTKIYLASLRGGEENA